MLELMDKSKNINRFMWSLAIFVFIWGITWVLPELITATRWW